MMIGNKNGSSITILSANNHGGSAATHNKQPPKQVFHSEKVMHSIW